eukprot:CAMPEP_0201645780 /NCGR_PEP_ID=MMETSP0493-20130528/32744_1 /ASSEMBLY_ACC=CAM_ASM_000838 /TAXON_ID=420259 /ORGANISM="Thalassiosira gravida, Strain GMp14c1" /LENGTH=482 /DNA_ID=CAMNT_0048120797 /DNA_START=107 /DNA_END=1555 /DNA_ORIENTATION=-
MSSSFTNALDQIPATRYAAHGTAVFGSSYSNHRRSTMVTSNTKYDNFKRTRTLNHTVTASSASISLSQHQSSQQQHRQHQQHHWTASDRAERVDRDSKLQRLLSNEIEKRGVFTAAGYKAVHQQFLYGEAVERELKRVNERRSSRRQRQQEQEQYRHQQPPLSKSRSRQQICRSLVAALSTSSDQLMMSKRRSSSSVGGESVASTSRRSSYNTTTTIDYDTMSSDNIAPVKTSVVRVLTPEERDELLREIQDENDQDQMSGGRKTLLMKSALANIDRSHNRNDARMDDSNRSMNLRDVFDGMEGSHLVKPPSLSSSGVSTQRSSKSKKKSHHRASLAHVVPTARPSTRRPIKLNTSPAKTAEEEASNKRLTCTMNLLKMSSLPVQFDDEVSVDDECGWLPWNDGEDLIEPFRHHQSRATCEEGEEDTFLPRKKEDDYDRVVRHPSNVLFQQPITYQGCEGGSEDDSFMPWPEVLKNHRARAA